MKQEHRRVWFKRVRIGLAVVLIVCAAVSTEALIRFNSRHRTEPYLYGISFSAEYADYLGLDPHQTLEAIFKDVHPKQVRLMSYWDRIEPKPGKYDFSGLDWQFELAKQYGVKVSLAVGLRQPRFPECHYPDWAKNQSDEQIYSELTPFIGSVVNRYKDNPALIDYQLENEALLTVFGQCRKFSRQQLVKEFNQIHQLDPNKPVVVNVSNEYGLPVRAPLGDEIGFSVYRRVYDNTVFHHFINYPFPTLWFRLRAAIIERYLGGTVFIHELQAEPWGAHGTADLSMADQDRAFDVADLRATEKYARRTGIKRIDFWGAEWWYWRKVHFHDDSVWDTAKEIFSHQ